MRASRSLTASLLTAALVAFTPAAHPSGAGGAHGRCGLTVTLDSAVATLALRPGLNLSWPSFVFPMWPSRRKARTGSG